MFGHSLGGDTATRRWPLTTGSARESTSTAAHFHRAVHPCHVGELARAVATSLGGRPFIIMSSDGHGPFAVPGQGEDPTMVGFWANLTGWRLLLTMAGSQHLSYTDYEDFLSQLTAAGIISASQAAEVVIPYIGTVIPVQAIAAERAYIRAFFDLQLRHRNHHLLDGPSDLFTRRLNSWLPDHEHAGGVRQVHPHGPGECRGWQLTTRSAPLRPGRSSASRSRSPCHFRYV